MTKKRAVTLFWFFFFILSGLLGHLAYVQLILGPGLSRQALAQQSQFVALEIPPRGQILDRNLKPLTEDREVWRAVVFPAVVTDKWAEAAALASILEMDYREALSCLTGKAKVIPLDLRAEQRAELEKRRLPGVTVCRVKLRSRKPPLASHVLGYLGLAGPDNWAGKMGLEAYYDRELRGSMPELAARLFLDGKGKAIPGLGCRVETGLPDQARKQVVLTIDRDIQGIVEKALAGAGVKDGAAVVMDVRDGDILAMASRPDYTLDPAQGTPTGSSFLNHALSLYQPGSVFKVIVAAAALEEGLVRPDQVFLCAGEKDDLVKCYKQEGHGLLTFAEAFAYSCNPAFARVGLGLGAQKLIDYAGRFGLNTTGIIGSKPDSPAEQQNLKTGLSRIAQPHNLVNASLGQWPVQANVVQMTAMMGTIAGNGVYTPPRLVREIRNSDGTTARIIEPGQRIRVISGNTAQTVKTMLELVTKSGTGRQALVEPGGSAGKTGSAQVGPAQINAWFSGYAPAGSPRYVATVLVNDGESGGQTAAPIFREIMQEILELEK